MRVRRRGQVLTMGVHRVGRNRRSAPARAKDVRPEPTSDAERGAVRVSALVLSSVLVPVAARIGARALRAEPGRAEARRDAPAHRVVPGTGEGRRAGPVRTGARAAAEARGAGLAPPEAHRAGPEPELAPASQQVPAPARARAPAW